MKSHIVLTLALTLSLALWGCGGNQSQTENSSTETPTQEFAGGGGTAVQEVIHSGGYTYVKVEEGSELIWAAGPETSVEVGDRITLSADKMPMQDFHSKTLDRTFDVVYFVSSISKVGEGAGGGNPHADMESAEEDLQEIDYSGIEQLADGQTVAQIYAEKASLTGKPVKVRGLVVKVNANIMKTNWVHLRDGTGEPGSNDLMITTQTLPKVGDTIIAEGELHTDIDFGAGYSYPVIIEDATVTIQ